MKNNRRHIVNRRRGFWKVLPTANTLKKHDADVTNN